MKRILMSLLGGILLLTACGQTSSTQITPIPIVDKITATPSPIPTNTNTSVPTETPTATVTPLPTISAFTPTFDASTIVTITPAPKAECPRTVPYPKSTLDPNDFKGNIEDDLLGFLNTYDPQPLVNAAQNAWWHPKEYVAFQDLSNDGMPELAMGSFIGIHNFYIFSCKNGKYEILLEFPPDAYSSPATFFSIKDNNRNGIPELTLLTGFMSQGGHFYEVYEWDGEKFANILSPFYPNDSDSRYLWVEATGKIHYEDVDNDFRNELILDSGVPVWETYYSGLPLRNKRIYYKWNGQNYAQYKIEFSQPEFRFQAIQDGDLAFYQREYDKALSLYQEAIFSDKLKGYSPEIRGNLRAQWDAKYGTTPTPTPYPIALDEYPKLAAYAYYRIMVLHLVQNHESDATTVYSTLQKKFGSDQYGRPYVEMATAFWDAYQSMHKMYDGCAAAIQYTAEHPEILTPLGSDYHGWQSHIYMPADMCPFR